MVPAWDGEALKIADTPYQKDFDCKRALNEQLPATNEEFAALKNKYGGTCHSHIGTFSHIQQVAYVISGFPVIRPAQFDVALNKAAFKGFER